MEESARALSKKYGVELESILLHITDLLNRFTNAALKDTCKRVGGDPARKLSPQDRLIGSSTLALEVGITPAYIAIGAAAGLHRYLLETEGVEQNMADAKKVLESHCELAEGSELETLILNMYALILEGKSLPEIRRAADNVVKANLKDVI